MSIIYDALKKIDLTGNKDLADNPQKDNKKDNKKPQPKTYLLYILVALFGFLAASAFFNLVKKEPVIKELPLPPPPSAVLPQAATAVPPVEQELNKPEEASFVLNGIFFSEDEAYALINNRVVKAGDEIEGATVVRITSDEVELKQADVSRILSSAN